MSGCCPAPVRSGAVVEVQNIESLGRDPMARDRREAVTLRGGRSTVGTRQPLFPIDGEGPERTVTVRPFAMSPYAVSNERFAAFVDATGYRSEAEDLGWSVVFASFIKADEVTAHKLAGIPLWWSGVEGASWHAPEGPGSSLAGRETHPVVHMSLRDAKAYAHWAGGRLPTEAEWEYAARGGLRSATYPWGEQDPNDRDFTPCNIWQGRFPERNTSLDGFLGTAPVDAFEPNGFGLWNMSGNAWEWSADKFRVRSISRMAKARNEHAAKRQEYVIKGGSYLCHASYCHRYRIAGRSSVPPDSGTGHLGFRLAFDLER